MRGKSGTLDLVTRSAIIALALAISSSGCAPDPDPSPSPDPTPAESSTGDSEETVPAQSAAPSHEEAIVLLRAADVPLADIANQDCAPVGEGLTVAALVEDSAANAPDQSTECAPDGAAQLCATEFTNNSGDEMEEFYVKLEYRVEGGAIVEWRGCVFAG